MSYRSILAVALATIIISSAAAALAVPPSAPPISGAGPLAVAPMTSAGTAAPATHGSAAASPDSSGTSREKTVLQQLHTDEASLPSIRLPDLFAPRPYPDQPVSPTYASAPAPIGVADLGLSNTSGTLTGSILDTSSVEGTISITNAVAAYLDGSGPDSYGIQLNAVDTGVTVFGNDTYQYWVQNYAGYTSSTHQLELGDEIWNWSSYFGYFPSNGVYANGPNGTFYPGELYQGYGPTWTIDYPFTLTLYENATTLFDRPAIFLNYTLSNSSMRISGTYDFLVFNSTAGTPISAAAPGQFQINGEQLTPAGLPADLELDLCGNGGGVSTVFTEMQASLSIATWDPARAAYEPVPSAYDAGAETGETAVGISVHWNGVTPVAEATLGPSFVGGLWNLSSQSGAREIVQTVNPAPAFIFVNPGTALNASEAQWVVSSPTGTTTFYLPNGGDYWLEYLLADHDRGGMRLTAPDNSTTTTSFTLALDMGVGVYTPLIAFGNGELASLSSGGTGTAIQPYTLFDNQYGSLDPEFALVDDFLFPIFPGLLLVGTTDHVTVTPASFEINYPSWILRDFAEVGESGAPATNDLQIQFWNASHVRVVDGTISGWLPEFAIDDGAAEAPLMFWASTDDLVADDTFLDQGDAVFLYGGSGNTVWGNSFFPAVVGATNPSDVLNYGAAAEGVNESESGDVVYDNYFDVGIPALTAPYDAVSCNWVCEPTVFSDSWNVSLEPASVAPVVLGVTLTGSIIGTWYQGGNYWSNYGDTVNPYGVLPYNDSGLIGGGAGDYVPLVPFALYNATFLETGLPAGTSWGVSVLVNQTSTAATLNVSVPNGTYEYTVNNPTGFTTGGEGEFSIDGADTSVFVTFAPAVNLSFEESGLSTGLGWSVELNGSELGGISDHFSTTAGSAIVFVVATGTYFYNVTSAGYAAAPASGETIVLAIAVAVAITFQLSTALTFNEAGLADGTTWTVWLTQGDTTTALSSNTNVLSVNGAIATPGAYNFSVAAPDFIATPDQGSGLLPQNATQNLTFALETGTFNGTITPATASLWIDGSLSSLGLGGSFSITLPVGIHSVELAAPGFTTYFDNVSIVAGANPPLIVTLLGSSVSAATGALGISAIGWALIGFLAILAAVCLLLFLLFAGRRRLPPREILPHDAAPIPATIVAPSLPTVETPPPLREPETAPAPSQLSETESSSSASSDPTRTAESVSAPGPPTESSSPVPAPGSMPKNSRGPPGATPDNDLAPADPV